MKSLGGGALQEVWEVVKSLLGTILAHSSAFLRSLHSIRHEGETRTQLVYT